MLLWQQGPVFVILMRVLNSTTPNTHFSFKMFGHNSCMIRIIVNFASKFPNFRYHGKRVGLFKFPLRTLNNTNLKTPYLVQDFGHRSYVNQITDDSVSIPKCSLPWQQGLAFQNSNESVENFFRVMSGLCLGACMPNLMFEHLAILEILTFNAPKMGSRDPDHALFSRFFFRTHIQTLPGIMHAKF